MSVVDVFISNYPVINWDLYDLWVEGYTEREALARTSLQVGPAVQLVDLHDNFRIFSLWETLLHQPVMFSSQCVFQLDCDTQNVLIEKYYALDSAVVRDLLGKKFSNRLKKDLDEVSDRSKVSLRSCRRQFDNIKRVFRTMEELPGNFLKNIKTNFLLPESLAEKYSIITFIACHRFEVAKKKLNYLSFEDFSLVCKAIMKNWTYNEVDVDENGDPSLDRDFFYNLRDLKSLLEKEKDHRYSVCQTLGKNQMKQRSLSEIEANFKSMNKNILWIGQTLYNNKEIKDLFVNVVDKIIEPMAQYKLSLEELKQVNKVQTENLTVTINRNLGGIYYF